MQCPHCGADLPEDDVYCEVCGQRILPRPEDHQEMLLSADFAGVTDRGLKRFRNEDRFAIRAAGAARILVVCDGVSSSHESQLASSVAVSTFCDALAEALLSNLEPEPAMRAALDAAARAVAAAGQNDEEYNPPSTTIVAALVHDHQLTVGWAGDSRAYWISGGHVRQVSIDHGTPEQAHGITRWLGADASEGAAPDILQIPLDGPGIVLLCSDGLWNYAPGAEELRRLVNPECDALTLVRGLVEFARSQGGSDNVTVAALRVQNDSMGEALHGE